MPDGLKIEVLDDDFLPTGPNSGLGLQLLHGGTVLLQFRIKDPGAAHYHTVDKAVLPWALVLKLREKYHFYCEKLRKTQEK